MSTKCLTPNGPITDFSEHVNEIDASHTNEIQVADEIFMPLMEFHALVCTKLEKLYCANPIL
jgi:hypothetical protein